MTPRQPPTPPAGINNQIEEFWYATQLALLIGRGVVLPAVAENVTWDDPTMSRSPAVLGATGPMQKNNTVFLEVPFFVELATRTLQNLMGSHIILRPKQYAKLSQNQRQTFFYALW